MKGYKLRRGMSYFARSFLFSFFSRCGRFIARKILPFCLVILLSFSIFVIPSFAAGGNLIVDNMQQWTTIYNTYDTAPSIVYSQPLNSITTPSSSVQYELFLKSKSVASANIYAGHTYKLSFDVKGDFSKCNLQIFTCLNGRWNSQNGQGVTELGSVYSNMSNFTTFSASFVPSQLYSSGSVTTIYIGLQFLQQSSGSTTLYIRNISLIDTDDDAGFWSTLWNKLNDIMSYLNGVLTNIQNGFSNLASWLSNVKDGIVNGLSTVLNNVKTAITNAISGIQQWFIDLKDNIINGLKALFIPSDGYFSGKMTEMDTWLTAHFGALYQGPQLGVEFVRQIFNFTPNDNFTITVPNYEFDFLGEHYVLFSGGSLSFAFVNDSEHPLHNFYVFYRAFVTIILFFMFFAYLKNKYLQIFNNGVGVDDS